MSPLRGVSYWQLFRRLASSLLTAVWTSRTATPLGGRSVGTRTEGSSQKRCRNEAEAEDRVPCARSLTTMAPRSGEISTDSRLVIPEAIRYPGFLLAAMTGNIMLTIRVYARERLHLPSKICQTMPCYHGSFTYSEKIYQTMQIKKFIWVNTMIMRRTSHVTNVSLKW